MSDEYGSLNDASTAAMASLETGMDSTPEVDTPAPDPVSAAPDSAPATTPEMNIPEFKGTRHKVKVRGTEEEVEYDELLKGYSRQADYTRAKQELAEQAKAVQAMEQQIAAAQQQLQQVYGQDPLIAQAAQVAESYGVPFSQALQAVVQMQAQQSNQLPEMDANEIATVSQAQAIAEQRLAAMQQQMATLAEQMQGWTQQQIQAAKSEIQTSQQSQAYASDINTTLGQIFEQNPILNAVEGMEDILRFKVYQADPATVEEAKDLFVRFAQEQAEKIQSQFTELTKSRIATKQKLATGGIEPPGGAGITPQPTNYDFGSKDLRNAAESYLKNLMR